MILTYSRWFFERCLDTEPWAGVQLHQSRFSRCGRLGLQCWLHLSSVWRRTFLGKGVSAIRKRKLLARLGNADSGHHVDYQTPSFLSIFIPKRGSVSETGIPSEKSRMDLNANSRWRFRQYSSLSPTSFSPLLPFLNPLRPLAIAKEMSSAYTPGGVSPVPASAGKFQGYIQDRRVVGVRPSPP